LARSIRDHLIPSRSEKTPKGARDVTGDPDVVILDRMFQDIAELALVRAHAAREIAHEDWPAAPHVADFRYESTAFSSLASFFSSKFGGCQCGGREYVELISHART
jgi:hypothetical protein